MTRLFLERCPAPVAGITGSSGKTTTTALVGAMLEAAGIDHVVGGNIGVGLLGLLDSIGPETKPVVELSHTQLQSVESQPAARVRHERHPEPPRPLHLGRVRRR